MRAARRPRAEATRSPAARRSPSSASVATTGARCTPQPLGDAARGSRVGRDLGRGATSAGGLPVSYRSTVERAERGQRGGRVAARAGSSPPWPTPVARTRAGAPTPCGGRRALALPLRWSIDMRIRGGLSTLDHPRPPGARGARPPRARPAGGGAPPSRVLGFPGPLARQSPVALEKRPACPRSISWSARAARPKVARGLDGRAARRAPEARRLHRVYTTTPRSPTRRFARWLT